MSFTTGIKKVDFDGEPEKRRSKYWYPIAEQLEVGEAFTVKSDIDIDSAIESGDAERLDAVIDEAAEAHRYYQEAYLWFTAYGQKTGRKFSCRSRKHPEHDLFISGRIVRIK